MDDRDALSVSLKLKTERAARYVARGGVVAYPTEAVFGIGCLPGNIAAVARIVAIKRRSWRKGVLLIGASLQQIDRWAVLDTSPFLEVMLAGWPGPQTWVLPARPRTPDYVTGGRSSVAVRVTAHPVAAELCRRAGSALVSTSANSAGRPPLREASAVRRSLGALLDDVLAGPIGVLASPTPIRDGLTGRVLRG